MVSNASEDFPDPETPVTTVRALWGISKSMFLRLWTRAPRTTMLSLEIKSDINVASDALVRGRLAALASEAVSATRGRQTTPGELPNLSIIKQASSRIRRLRQIKTSSSSDSTFPLL